MRQDGTAIRAFEACESGPCDASRHMVRQLEARGLPAELAWHHMPTCCLVKAFNRAPNIIFKYRAKSA